MINLIRSEKVTPTEIHYEIEINGKIVQFAKWVEYDFSLDFEFILGKELLTEEEEEEVKDFINEAII